MVMVVIRFWPRENQEILSWTGWKALSIVVDSTYYVVWAGRWQNELQIRPQFIMQILDFAPCLLTKYKRWFQEIRWALLVEKQAETKIGATENLDVILTFKKWELVFTSSGYDVLKVGEVIPSGLSYTILRGWKRFINF